MELPTEEEPVPSTPLEEEQSAVREAAEEVESVDASRAPRSEPVQI